MKGKYKTQSGETVEVLNFDENNKIAYVDFGNGDVHWTAQSDYGGWTSVDKKSSEPIVEQEEIKEEDVSEPVPDVVEEVNEETQTEHTEEPSATTEEVVEKPKRGRKKKQ